MKPFNLEQAKAGKPVCTREGDYVELLRFDLYGNAGPIGGVVCSSFMTQWQIDGKYNPQGLPKGMLKDNSLDLFMASEKREGWVNVFQHKDNPCIRVTRGNVFTSKDDAQRWVSGNPLYIRSVKIELEE